MTADTGQAADPREAGVERSAFDLETAPPLGAAGLVIV